MALATAGCRCPLLWDECRIVSFDCGRGRSIDLYVDSLCDVYTFIQYRVRDGRRVVAPMTGTGLGFSCGDWDHGFSPSAYRLVADDTGNLVAVTFMDPDQGETVALVFDFDQEKSIVRAPDPAAWEFPREVLERLGLSASEP
ncbi:MAG: hypothetical protein AAGC60_03650 [Acidobacteriota bacterium]